MTAEGHDLPDSSWNPFDLTKVWPHGDCPAIDIGTMELNRNPDNYFAEIEQAAFAPSNIVPGIGFSPDKMLQARIFSYADAHRYRLGTHSTARKRKKRYAEPPLPLDGDADRYNHRDGNDDTTQAGNLFRRFNAEQKQRLFDNIAPRCKACRI